MARPRKFQPTWYVTVYQLARDGMSDRQIAAALDIGEDTLRTQKKDDAALRDALNRGRRGRKHGDEETFGEYVFDHLPPKLQELWKQIEIYSTLKEGVELVNALLEGQGVRVRQHLFMYAMTQSMFNVSASMRKLGISRQVLQHWRDNDPDFAALMGEIEFHRKNFFEAAGMGRIAAGDTAMIMHALKTQCRDRGWNDKVEIVHSGSISNPDTISIADLNLDIETRKKVLDALRAKQTADQQAKAQAAAEVVATP